MARERRTKLQKQPCHTTTASFSATIIQPINYALSHHLHHSLHCLHPFSQQQCNFPPRSHYPKLIQSLSRPHNSAHTIQLHLQISQIPHNPPGIEPHPSLLQPHISLYPCTIFFKLYYFNVLFIYSYFFFLVLHISCLNLVLHSSHRPNLNIHFKLSPQTLYSSHHSNPPSLHFYSSPSSPVNSLPSLPIAYQTTLSSLPSSPPAFSIPDLPTLPHSCYCISCSQQSITHSHLY